MKILLLTLLIFGVVTVSRAPLYAGSAEENNACFSCHQENVGQMFDVAFSDGERRSISFNKGEFFTSIHGKKIDCIDCHQGYTYPHPEITYTDVTEFKRAKIKNCQRCHFENYKDYQDGIHKEIMVCGDCHGTHNIQSAKENRIALNGKCTECHSDALEAYQNSVHGDALKGNKALPLCTGCHKAHEIKGTTEKKFKVTAYKICEQCHDVASYLDDFHGMSNKLYEKGAGTYKEPIASCADCHGSHSIQKNLKVSKELVVKKCQKCHEGAVPNFADSWLSHYPPTLQSAPVVWAVTWMYRIFIPLTLLGLIFHIFLHFVGFIKKKRKERHENEDHH